jgi:predicted O-methyltransferase YrrM
MPLLRTFDSVRGRVVINVHSGYLDRLSKWSDIQEYLPFLYETAKSYPKVRVLELGTRKGNSTLAFLAGAKTVDGSVTSVDLDRVTDNPDGMLAWRNVPYWRFIQGSDLDEAVQALLPVEVDVLFIDTSHEYEHTLQELRLYMPRVVKGGVALFHDTKLKSWYGYEPPIDAAPVTQALNDYCDQEGISWEELPGVYGLGVIRA